MQFVVIIAIIVGLPVLITIIRQRFFSDKPAEPPEEVDLLNNPISHAMPEGTRDSQGDPDETTVPIYKLRNLVEAGALKALLEEHGIDCMVHSFMDYAYDGLWQAQKGWGVLKVLAKDQAKAEDLIDVFLESNGQADESTPNELAQATPVPADKPAFPGIIFTVALVVLIGIVVLILIGIFSTYRESGQRLAEEGYGYSINNEYDKAIEYYDKAISRWYRESWVYNNRGYERYIKGDLDNAIKDYDKAIELDPKYNLAWANKGYALGQLGRHEEALEAFNKSIGLNPDSVYAWDGKGYTLSKLGRYEESLKVLGKAIELDPKAIDAWDNKAYALGKLGRYEESFKAFDKAITLDPKNAVIWYNRACIYSFRNDKQDVFDGLKKAISLDAKLKAEAQKDEDFKWLWEDEEFKKATEGKK